MPLRVAAISFLNPAPLLYNFEHEPHASALRTRYALHYTTPAQCARELLEDRADLGLIPIAALTPELAVVPGCTIASLHEVRSILLLVKNPEWLGRDDALRHVRTIAADAASRSSNAYAHILFERYLGARPQFVEEPAAPEAMLATADAALLIGDPALLARERHEALEAAVGAPLLWLDVAALWREFTGLPWVAAVWAVRPEALARDGLRAAQLIDDCVESRDAGLAHVEELVREWTPKIGVPAETIRSYLTRNIHYTLDDDCLRTIAFFRESAAALGTLPPLGPLNLLR